MDCSKQPDESRTLSALCAQRKAAAGTAGGYFLRVDNCDEGHRAACATVGLIVTEGVVVSPPVFSRPALIVDDQRHVFIRRIGMKGVAIEAGPAKFIARKVNAPVERGEIAVYNQLFGRRAPEGGGFYFSVVGLAVIEASDKPIEIPLNGFAVAVNPGAAPLGPFADIVSGDVVKYSLPSMPGVGRIISAMAGGPTLPKRPAAEPDWKAEDFNGDALPLDARENAAAHLPRLAWGITQKHELIACSVDGCVEGRQGMPLESIARLMAQQGCVEALFMEGESSERIWVQGMVRALQTDDAAGLLSSAIIVRPS